MSGLTGFYRPSGGYDKQPEQSAAVLADMCAALKKRGGANQSARILPHACIAQTAKGAETVLRVPHEGASACIALDGELYHSCGVGADAADYVLRLILREGIDAIDCLNGAFAGAAYVESEQRLYLFRDHLGVKPLFFARFDGGVLFGSEIKAILRYPGFTARVSREGLCEVLGLGPARRELSGVFEDVYSVLPGHYAVFDADGFHQVKYWGLDSFPSAESFDEAARTTAGLLQDAVARRGGGRKCAFMSGGLDSGLVTALLATNQTAPVDTFSFDFVDSDKHFQANDFQSQRDRPYVEQMVRLLGTRHSFLECDSDELADALEDAMRARDLPGMADIDASLLVFARRVAEDFDVALTGECADEIFNGYPWFHKADLMETNGFPWSNDYEMRTAFLRAEVKDTLDVEGFARGAYAASVASVPTLFGEDAARAKERELSFLTQKWIMPTLVDRTDRMCAAAGLGARVPFADKRLVEYAWNLPAAIKNRGGVKGLLRAGFAGLLPEELLWRKKNPYPKTYNPHFEKLLAARLLDVLSDPNAPIRALADVDRVRAFIAGEKDYGRPWYGQLMAGPQLLGYWLQMNAWLKAYRIEIKI